MDSIRLRTNQMLALWIMEYGSDNSVGIRNLIQTKQELLNELRNDRTHDSIHTTTTTTIPPTTTTPPTTTDADTESLILMRLLLVLVMNLMNLMRIWVRFV